MDTASAMHAEEPDNPLVPDTPDAWDRVIEAVGPATMLVAIESRIGKALAQHLSPEDIWQETLLCAWRGRARMEWRGVASFRRYLLQVAENRIRDHADALRAGKRQGDGAAVRLDRNLESTTGSSGSMYAGPIDVTTPSRSAQDREKKELFQDALDALPANLREVVRLRLFEGLPMAEVANCLGIGESAAFHRFRKGAESFYARVRTALSHRGDRPHDGLRPPPR